MKFTTLKRFAILLFITLLAAGCATASKPIGEWRSESFSGKLDNILVIGVTSRSTRRRVYEDKFVEALATAGKHATPSYELLTSSMHLDRPTVENAIKGQNMGGVLVTRLVGIKEKQTYKLPDHYDDDRGYFGYYDHAWQKTSTGYYSGYKVFTLETSLYDVASGDLVWSMQSEAMDASKPRVVIEEQIKLAIASMSRQGLI